jgi:thiamine biosynthesis lipoprotein
MKLKKPLIFTANRLVLVLLVSFGLMAGPVSAAGKYTQVQYIMGTLFRIELYAGSHEKADKAFREAFREIRKYDLVMSNYRPDSELTRVLKTATAYPATVSPEFYDILKESLDFSELTGGRFDVTVGPLVKLWGFKDKNFKKPAASLLKKIKEKVGYRNIYLNPYNRTLYLKKKDMEIDFGAIGKGYAIDQAVKVLRKDGIVSGIIDAVSNQYYLGSPPGGGYWKIGIKHPRNQNEVIKYLYLKDTAVSTSGDYEQFFVENNTRYSHIINPLTGYPVKDAVASTVVMENGAAADALSTSVMLLGERETGELLKRFNNIYLFKVVLKKEFPFKKGGKNECKFYEYRN